MSRLVHAFALLTLRLECDRAPREEPGASSGQIILFAVMSTTALFGGKVHGGV